MSYQYRRRKREVAHFILTQVYEDSFNPPNDGPPDYGEQVWTFSTLSKHFPQYTWEEYRGAVQLLEFNHHVSCTLAEPDGFPDGPLRIYRLDAGTEAMLDGFYEKENQKDNLERFELRTRWVLPIASFIFSLAALVLSLLNHFYPKK